MSKRPSDQPKLKFHCHSSTSGPTHNLNSALFLGTQKDASKGEVDARPEDLLANRKAVVPEGVGRLVHEQKASMSELQLHRLNLSAALLPSSVSVPEDEVSSCS